MSAEDSAPLDEQCALWLAACDEALAAGFSPVQGVDAPVEVRERLERGLAFLRRLHGYRPSRCAAGAAPAGEPPQVGPPPVSRYSRTCLHATGGIGQVWLAYDSILGREVALKELRPERAADPALANRFWHEARITGRLQHPGIIPVYELGPGLAESEDGPGNAPPFYTMRFVKGRTLTEAARAYHDKRRAGTAGSLEQATLLHALINVGNAVAYAHARGVIHRDLKGQNVVLGDYGEVIVLDWGFAKALDHGDEGHGPPVRDAAWDSGPDQTMPGQVLGTPAYMAPEQAAGHLEQIGCHTDVYGLGAILYEILTGQPPFPGDDPHEVLRKVREEEPTRPGLVCAGVPPALEAVCRRALTRRPADRYPSVAALVQDVQRWLADEPVMAYREPLAARLGRWSRRHKPAVAALAALVAAVLAAVVAGALLVGREQARAAQVAADKAEAEARAKDILERELYFHTVALAEREWFAHQKDRADQLLDECPQRLRGWEWHYLKRLRHEKLAPLRGHTRSVERVAFSPDGRYIASPSSDHTVRLWDATNGRLVHTFRGHKDIVWSVAFSPSGQQLASAGWDGLVKIWNVNDPTEGPLDLEGHGGQLECVAYHPGGRLLASASTDKTVQLWDTATGQIIRTLVGHAGNVYSVAFSPDGLRLVSGSQDKTVRLWDVTTGREICTLNGHTSPVRSVAFSPDGWRVASASGAIITQDDGQVIIWDTRSGLALHTLTAHTAAVWGVAFSPDGQRLASASQDWTIKLWDVGTGQNPLTLRGHVGVVLGVAFSRDGRRLASASADETVRIWDATPLTVEAPRHEILTFRGHAEPVWGVAFGPDGSWVISGSQDQVVKQWEVRSGREIRTLHGRLPDRQVIAEKNAISSVAVSPNGKRIALVNGVHIQAWETAGGKQLFFYHRFGNPYVRAAFSPDGERLAVAGWDRTVTILDANTGHVTDTIPGHASVVQDVAYSPDGQRLATASFDATVGVWDVTSHRELLRLRGHANNVWSVAFSPDGKRLASSGDDQAIFIWDTTTGHVVRILRGHDGPVWCVVYSRDGKRLASASNDQTIKLWDAATGELLQTLEGHTGRVHSVAFSPDGQRLASASYDRTVKIWDASPVAEPGREPAK